MVKISKIEKKGRNFHANTPLRPTSSSVSLSLLHAAVVIFLAVCVIFPLLCVGATPTKDDFVSVLSSSVWHGAMRNTLIECVSSTFFSVLVGYLFAYAVVKADIPCKKFFALIPILHLMTPPFVGGLSFILLFGRQGFFTHRILHLDVSLYGFWGLLIAQVLCFFPIAYLMCAQTLRRINPSLEQAARAMGASKPRIALTVTIPLSLPGILSSALFIAVSVLSDFGNPMIVAGRFRVLAVEVYTQLTGWVSAGTSCVLALVLLVPSVLLFLAQNHVMKKQNAKIATIGAKDSSLPEKKSSKPTKVVLFLFCSFFSLLVAAQFVSIVMGAFQTLWGIDTRPTLAHIASIAKFTKELKNSLLFAFSASIAGTVLASLSVFFVSRSPLRLKKYIDICAQLPAAVPGSLFGLAFSLASARVGFRNSAVLIVIAMTVYFLPFSYRIISSVFAQIKTTLDDGARALGADKLCVLKTILLPLSRGGIAASFIYDFVRGVGTLSSVIFLVSFSTPLASIRILNLAEQGEWGKSAALATVLTMLTFSVLIAGRFIISILDSKAHKKQAQT